ncbi:hypothetical protein Scep_015514 [Stephania cephalantha]|uniref:Uncharacterized protein n=1 Tax=Stephania cephalantha TaxID=152367 RepID=A0AAP0P1E9_9MAGN
MRDVARYEWWRQLAVMQLVREDCHVSRPDWLNCLLVTRLSNGSPPLGHETRKRESRDSRELLGSGARQEAGRRQGGGAAGRRQDYGGREAGRRGGAQDNGRTPGGDGGGSGQRRTTTPARGRWRPHREDGDMGEWDAGKEAVDAAGTVGSQISVSERRWEEKQNEDEGFGWFKVAWKS